MADQRLSDAAKSSRVVLRDVIDGRASAEEYFAAVKAEVNAQLKLGHGFSVTRIKRLRRERWFWFRLSVGFGKRGWYVERY